MTARPLVALVAKDLHVFLVDRYAVVLTLLAPIALASFMASIFGGSGPTERSPVPVRVVDQDRSPASAAIVAASRADRTLQAEPSGRDEAIAAVRGGRAVAAVILPRGFGDAASEALLGSRKPPEVTFILDPTRQADLALARGVFTRLIYEAIAADSLGDGAEPAPGEGPGPSVERSEFLALFRGIDQSRGADDPDLEADRAEFRRAFPGLPDWLDGEAPAAAAKKPPALAEPYTARDVSITSDGPGGDRAALAAHAFAGMAAQFVLFSATEWGIGLMTERRKGLWKRLRSAPVSRHTLMASKAIGCSIVSLAVILIVLAFGSATFGFTVRGSGVGLALVAVAYACMASTLGLLVASLGRSPEGARAVSIMSVLVMTMLGGGWIPSFLFPAWLQRLTPAIPTRWAIDAFDGVLSRGFTLAETLPSFGVLMAFAAAFAIAAVACHRWDDA